MVEFYIYLIHKLYDSFTEQEWLYILEIFDSKLKQSQSEANGFLLYSRNPIKVCVLLVDLMKKKFYSYISPLRFQTEKLIENATNLAISIEFEIRDE